MAVAVAQPQRPQEFRPEPEQKVDPLDQILKGLQIASTVYGIKHNIDQNDLMKAKAATEQSNYGAEQEFKKQQFESDKLYKDQLLQIERDKIEASKKASLNEAPGKVMSEKIKQLEYEKKLADSMAEKKGKTLPASNVESLASSNAALKALEQANLSVQKSEAPTGPIAGQFSKGLAAFEIGKTGVAAKELDAQLKLNAQSIGKYLEGGKLTDEDIKRYKQMLPNLTDSPESAAKKTELLYRLISEKQKSEIEGLGQAGYDVGRIGLYEPKSPAKLPSAIQGNSFLPGAQAGEPDYGSLAADILKNRAIKNKGILGVK